MTGVSGGLGYAFAEMLLSEGVAVWGTARSVDRLGALSGRPGFSPVRLDLAEGNSLSAVFTAAEEQAGGCFDLLVNNAGYGVFGPFATTPFPVWRSQIEANLIGGAQLVHAALGRMLSRNRGCIVNVSSVAVEYPLPFMAGYNLGKSGLSALSESLIFETRGTAVTVIDFRPGDYRTPFNQSMQATSPALSAASDPRLSAAWRSLEANIALAPKPEHAAANLRKALAAGVSGTVYSGGIVQTRLAPLFARLAPARLRRAVAARYFGAA